MNDLAELLVECKARGIRLLPADQGRLTIDAPRGALTADLRERIKANKADLLADLTHKVDAPSAVPANAEDVLRAALDHLDGDPLFPPDVIEALRSAEAHWATDEPARGPDGWPLDSIEPPEPCPECGSLELWQTIEGDWRCLKCDPPTTARRLAQQAERIRRKKKSKK